MFYCILVYLDQQCGISNTDIHTQCTITACDYDHGLMA